MKKKLTPELLLLPVLLFTLMIISCTQTLILPTKKATEIPAETETEKKLIDKARAHFNNKNIDSAIIIFKSVLEINPANIRAVYYLAKANLELKKYNYCLEYCQIGLDYESEYYEHFAACLGEYYNAIGRTRSAISVLEEAAKKYPNNDKILFQLGKAYNLDRSYEMAENPLAYSIAYNPYFSNAHLELAKTYLFLLETSILVYPIITYLSLENESGIPHEAMSILDKAYERFYIRNDSLCFSSYEFEFDNLHGYLVVRKKIDSIPDIKELASENKFGKIIEKTIYLLRNIESTYSSYFEEHKNELLFRIYFKYLGDIYKNGFAEVFTYYIYSESGMEVVKSWLAANKEKVAAFRNWVKDYNWDL